MRRLVLPLLLLLATACSSGERDVDDVASDLEGVVTAASVDRVLRDVDLSRAPLTVHVGAESPERFDAEGQRALEDYLRHAEEELHGAVVEITQRTAEERPTGVTLTLTLPLSPPSTSCPTLLPLRTSPPIRRLRAHLLLSR
jgi:hypothetical protein